MFTGIVEELAHLEQVKPFAGGRRIVIAAACADEVRPGDSIALNGICLTAETVRRGPGRIVVSAVSETLRRTTAEGWVRGKRLHLERALAADGRFGGHIVQGHIDGVARVLKVGREGNEFVLTLQIPEALRRYVVRKGSLTVDGISLTVGDLQGGHCRLYIIPETLTRTLVGSYRPGERVNLEVDLVAKYVEAMAGAHVR